MSEATRRGDRPPSPWSLSNLSLKNEDRACAAVAEVCGEELELLVVADGHGGPEVSQHGQLHTRSAPRAVPPPQSAVPLLSLARRKLAHCLSALIALSVLQQRAYSALE